MNLVEDNVHLLQCLYALAAYSGAREPAAVLFDLRDPNCRCLWDDWTNETWEAWTPSLDPAELLVLDADCPGVGGFATGRLKLRRILREHLGESDVTDTLLTPTGDRFHVIVFAEGVARTLQVDQPPRQE